MYKGLLKYISTVLFIYVIWNLVLGYFSFLLFLLFILLFVFSWLISYQSMKKTVVKLHCDHSIIERQTHFYLSFIRQDDALIHCGNTIVDYCIYNAKREIVYQNRQSIYDDLAMDVIELTHSGYYEVEIQKIYCYDILQCLFLKKNSSQNLSLYVFPSLIPVQNQLQETVGYNQEAQDYSPYVKGEDYSEMFDLRPYHDQDSLKYIHWKASSKRQEFFVKEGSQPIFKKIILAYDIGKDDQIDDLTLDTLYSLCSLLLNQQVHFEMMCPQVHSQQVSLELILNFEHLRECLKRILRTPHISYQSVVLETESIQSLYFICGSKIEVVKS